MKIKTALTASVALVMVLAGTESALAVQPTGVTNLLGTWTNVNPTTGGVVKIEITNPGGVFTIHTYGACSPTPCDHGANPAHRDAAGFPIE